MTLEQITDQVWVYPHDPEAETVQPNVGVIITNSETVLVDAGNSPRHARQIQHALNSQGAPPVKYVILTHHHFDHSFGAQVWEGSSVIGHAQCRTLLLERYGGHPWSGKHIDEQIHVNPAREKALRAMERAVGDWVGFKVVTPKITFTDDLMLALDGVTLRLRHLGGQHAVDSISVLVEESRVLFIGDCYYPPPAGSGQTEAGTHDRSMVEGLLAQDVKTFVEGHDRPMSHAKLAAALKKL